MLFYQAFLPALITENGLDEASERIAGLPPGGADASGNLFSRFLIYNSMKASRRKTPILALAACTALIFSSCATTDRVGSSVASGATVPMQVVAGAAGLGLVAFLKGAQWLYEAEARVYGYD